MDAYVLNAEENQPRLKVSISARLISALAYLIPAVGGALSSILFMRLLRLMREAESAGIAAVMGGLAEVQLPLLGSLYLAAVCGLGVIVLLVVRMLVQTKTASPPGWFLAVGGILCFLSVALFWKAGALIIEALNPNSSIGAGGIAGLASTISWLLILSVIAAPFVFLLLVALSVWPLTKKSKPKWSPLIVATVIEVLLIDAAITFQMKFFWLQQSAAAERML